tara:strand:+ start:15536 stop:15916 length:381 start_codon:yes stop_codon:yes gene_type:complete
MNTLLSSTSFSPEAHSSIQISPQTSQQTLAPWEALEAERLLHSAHQTHQDMMDVLDVLGWHGLPNGLIAKIQEDIMGFVEELKGQFKSACPFVALRRERVTFWIEQVLQDPSLEAEAIQALHVKGL